MNPGSSSGFDAAEYGRTALTFIDGLGRLTSLEDIRLSTANAIRGFGIDYFTMVELPSEALDLPMSFFLSEFPPAWIDLYLDRAFDDVDPVVRRAFGSSAPFAWDDGLFDPLREPAARNMMGLAGDHGLRHGFSFSVRQARGPVGGVSLASRSRLALDGVTRPAIHLMALYALARAEVLRDPQSRIKPPVLSNRELEVLKWSAAGKTSSQIAAILRITERTTLAHAVNAAAKLGASNRTHAVARALALGLIAP